MKTGIFLLVLITAVVLSPLWANGPENLESPVLMVADATTGTVILEHNIDVRYSPASLTKLMTLHLSMTDVAEGALELLHPYGIPEGGSASDMRWGSSVLGLERNDSLTLLTLQRAAAICSANDAAWSLALISSGNINEFLERMNREAGRLGMYDTVYTDPDGWSELSVTTGRDQMTMALSYISLHPSALENLHNHMTLPFLDLDSMSNPMEKRNTNLLLGRYQGADGLKTGTIPSAGFHFIATAERDEIRFIALVMGLESEDFRQGLRNRAGEASALLDWAFGTYTTWSPGVVPVPPVVLRHGREDDAAITQGDAPQPMTMSLTEAGNVYSQIEMPETLTAPLNKGDIVGRILWMSGNQLIAEQPLVVAENRNRRWRLRDFFHLRRR